MLHAETAVQGKKYFCLLNFYICKYKYVAKRQKL